MSPTLSGSEALARGALEAGIAIVSSYAGSPATYVVNSLLELTSPDELRVEWTSNEKTALEVGFGASLAGVRSLVALKSVGLNIALDPLMTLNLSGCHAGMVIVLGDDPGSWGSQNEQDSRALVMAAELPVLEPTSVAEAQRMTREAFELSEESGLPVIVRLTRALALAQGEVEAGPWEARESLGFKREFNRWVVLPVNVVPFHLRLQRRVRTIQAAFERSAFNAITGQGAHGVIAVGFVYEKMMAALGGHLPEEARALRLGTTHPLPTQLVTAFLQEVEDVLVLEEGAPLVEEAVQALAHRAGEGGDEGVRQHLAQVKIYGRGSGHLPTAGELFGPHLSAALNRFIPGLDLVATGPTTRPRPSLKPLGEECFYTPVFDALREVMGAEGGRPGFIVVGDPGCMVRAQTHEQPLMDVKHSLGASLGMAAGLALQQHGPGAKRVVSLIGDSSFLHTGFNGLMDAVQLGARLAVVILDNGSTALSGGQPHPGSGQDARGRPRKRVDLAALAKVAGADKVTEVDVEAGEDLHAPLREAILGEGVRVVIARGRCECE